MGQGQERVLLLKLENDHIDVSCLFELDCHPHFEQGKIIIVIMMTKKLIVSSFVDLRKNRLVADQYRASEDPVGV